MISTKTALVLFLGLCWSASVFCEEDQNVTAKTTAKITTEVKSGLNEPNFETPEYILPCSRNDPKIDACFLNTILHLQPYLAKGIPELDLPPIEPLKIPELKIENGQGPVRIRAFFTNITVIGPGNFTINKVRVNMSLNRFDIHLSFPKFEIQGKYDINGNVLLFPIQSQGDFWAFLGNITAVARVQGIEKVKDGVRYLIINRMLVDFNLSQAKFRVTDHLNGNNVIGQAMNQFLNENVLEIIDEMRPAASSSISKHFKEFLNTAFSKVPLKIWMHDT